MDQKARQPSSWPTTKVVPSGCQAMVVTPGVRSDQIACEAISCSVRAVWRGTAYWIHVT